jgi:hypothetical protein
MCKSCEDLQSVQFLNILRRDRWTGTMRTFTSSHQPDWSLRGTLAVWVPRILRPLQKANLRAFAPIYQLYEHRLLRHFRADPLPRHVGRGGPAS